MKYTFILMLGVLLCSESGFGQNHPFSIANVPKKLLENAHSVKREETVQFDIDDIDEARLMVHQVITVLDAEGRSSLDFVKLSSAFRRLTDAEIKVYDSQGALVNHYKLKEINSESMGDGLVEDGKVYYFRVAAPSYPITVEYDYEIKYKGTLSYPKYSIQDPDQAVQSSQFIATVPLTLGMRYKPQNTKIAPSVASSGNNKVYSWAVQNLSAIPDEDGAADENADFPMVLLAPNKFSMDGYEGDLTSWKTFGNWYENLASGANNLSEATKADLQKLVAGITDKKLKIRILYHYLQKNFRYVSIQLGIGGFRPLDASFVDEKKYGDCKALSNYMQACLAAVGIPSYQALVNSGFNSKPVNKDFPINDFDHVILCVPIEQDSIWLECTSNITDFDQLGSFTENRYALLITPSGGVLVRTPKSKASENTFNCHTVVKLSGDGSGTLRTAIRTTGEYREEMIDYVLGEDKDKQKRFLVSYLGFNQPDDFNISQPSGDDSTAMDLSASEDKIPEFMAGSKMFLNPRLYKIWKGDLPLDTARSMPFYLNCPFEKRDTTVYQLPPDYTVETLPDARDEEFALGSYKTRYEYDYKNNTVTTYADLEMRTNVIEPKDYMEAVKFFSNVIDEYTQKIVIKEK